MEVVPQNRMIAMIEAMSSDGGGNHQKGRLTRAVVFPMLLSVGFTKSRIMIPKFICKYEKIDDYSLKNLEQRTFFCQDPRKFNDPFDCNENRIHSAIKAGLGSCSVAVCRQIANEMLNGADVEHEEMSVRILEAPDDVIREITTNALVGNMDVIFGRGVSCFAAEKFDDLLMWGHYADSHRGMCLRFRTGEPPFNEANGTSYGLLRVNYAEQFPIFDASKIAHGELNHFLIFLTSKATCWSYEGEWRILSRDKGVPIGYPMGSLTEVYFGMRTSNRDIDAVRQILDRRPSRLFQMRMSPSGYRLEAESI